MNDYGYFGKGTTGYVHYKQAFDRNGSKGPGRKNPKNGKPGGFPSIIVLIFLAIGLIGLLSKIIEFLGGE